MTAASRPPELVEALKVLHLPTMRRCYAAVADQARQESLSYEHYLVELVHQEWYTRREHRIARFLRESHLPLEKNLATLDRQRLSAKLQAQLTVLLEGTFLDQAENVLAFGTPGSGKTHLLCAVGQELIYQQERPLRFYDRQRDDPAAAAGQTGPGATPAVEAMGQIPGDCPR